MNQTLNDVLRIIPLSVMITAEFDALQSLSNIPQDVVNKFKNYINYKLEKYLLPFLNYEVIYQDAYCSDNIAYLTSRYAMELWKLINYHYLLLDKSFTDFEKIGNIISEIEQSTGYGGFSINNQDGDFQKSKSSSKNNANRLQYITLLNMRMDDVISEFVNEIITRVCRLIY